MKFYPENSGETRRRTIGMRRISVSLVGTKAHGYLFERREDSPSRPISSMYVDPSDAVLMSEFIRADPLSIHLKDLYDGLWERIKRGEPSSKCAASQNFSSDCASELELMRLLANASRQYGAEFYFYHRFAVNDRTREIERHAILIGGSARWAHRYVENHWYLNDPILAHSLVETRPLRGSSVRGLSAGHWLLQQTAQYGVASNVFFPAHGRADGTIGLLHVGTSEAAPRGEEMLWHNRRVLRGLAAEIMDWYVERERREALGAWALTDAQLAALRLVARGGSARHVARELGMDERAVYRLFAKINHTMDCAHIKISANKAMKFGLFNID